MPATFVREFLCQPFRTAITPEIVPPSNSFSLLFLRRNEIAGTLDKGHRAFQRVQPCEQIVVDFKSCLLILPFGDGVDLNKTLEELER